ncbi:Capsule polysaccharide biosynthesis protein [Crateriforma conspicua]|nr:Capsule polysaccharide biosynthesis protein [Crateriforma conspicua]
MVSGKHHHTSQSAIPHRPPNDIDFGQPTMKPRLLFLADNVERARFFVRVHRACQESGIDVRFLAYRKSSHGLLRSHGAPVELLSWRRSERGNTAPDRLDQCAAESLEYLRGDVTLESLRRLAGPVCAAIESQLHRMNPTHLFLWNGSQFVERLAAAVCPPSVATRYMEIGNIPGKLFIDDSGVNAASSIRRNPDRLRLYTDCEAAEYESWKSAYWDRKLGVGVPQAKSAIRMQWERPRDWINAIAGRGIYPIQPNAMFGRFSDKWHRLRKAKPSSAADDTMSKLKDLPSTFRFLPLQVSCDTQLLLHSDVNNQAAIERAAEQSNHDGLALVIKPHPAETNRSAIQAVDRQITRLRSRRLKVYQTREDTADLIQRACHVCTINSTVGLEALIAGKPVSVYGRAFFESFIDRPDLLRRYLTRFLADADYFADQSITPTGLERMIDPWPQRQAA